MDLYWIWTVVCSGAGRFWVRIYERRARTWPRHEDIDKLVDQVRAVTKATKEIEAKISDEAWDRQKRFEIRKEVLFDAVKRLSEAENALLSLAMVFKAQREKGQAVTGEAVSVRLDRWLQASEALDETRLLVGIVCGVETRKAFEEFGSLVGNVASNLAKDKDIYEAKRHEVTVKLYKTREAIKNELGIHPVTYQSNLSSAIQVPAPQAPGDVRP
jgi:DNA helicase IV